MQTKHFVNITVFGVVTYVGNIMLLFFFPRTLTLNTESNIECLEKLVLPWIERVIVERPTCSNRTLCHAIKARLPCVGSQKISANTFTAKIR